MDTTVARSIMTSRLNRQPVSELSLEQQEELFDWVYNAYQLIQGIATVGKYADREKMIKLATGLV
jgi:hypothetical protein